jgi:hypothetical protein
MTPNDIKVTSHVTATITITALCIQCRYTEWRGVIQSYFIQLLAI